MGCAGSRNRKAKRENKSANEVAGLTSDQKASEPTMTLHDINASSNPIVPDTPHKDTVTLSVIDDDFAVQKIASTKYDNDIEKVYEHEDGTGNSTSILRTAYIQEKKFNPEETLVLLKAEAFAVLEKEINRPQSVHESISLIRSSIQTPFTVKDGLLEHAVILIRSGEIKSMQDLLDRLLLSNESKRTFTREEVDACIRALFAFSEDRATKTSLLKVIHEKLEKGNQLFSSTARHSGGVIDAKRNRLSNALDNLHLDAKEHENVEVTVRKSVKRRSITTKELEQRGVKLEDLKGKDVYFVSNAPEGLDEKLKAKTEQMMSAAGSIYNCDAQKMTKSISTVDEDDTNLKAIKEITKIMEAHKKFTIATTDDDILNFKDNTTDILQQYSNPKEALNRLIDNIEDAC
ncbi:hypothetical protein GJ496_011463 [Pomphorhynchus laevis]|nr:hypothetical protein GJ496_011463 [Pomphorhynchus laevis]